MEMQFFMLLKLHIWQLKWSENWFMLSIIKILTQNSIRINVSWVSHVLYVRIFMEPLLEKNSYIVICRLLYFLEVHKNANKTHFILFRDSECTSNSCSQWICSRVCREQTLNVCNSDFSTHKSVEDSSGSEAHRCGVEHRALWGTAVSQKSLPSQTPVEREAVCTHL